MGMMIMLGKISAFCHFLPRNESRHNSTFFLASKLEEGNIMIFDKLSCSTHKTKELANILSQVKLHPESGDNFTQNKPKFKSWVDSTPKCITINVIFLICSQHGLLASRTLILANELNEEFGLACRNLAAATAMLQTQATVYDVIKLDKLVFTADAFNSIQSRVLDQYTHKGKRKAYMSNMAMFLEANLGRL
jgi:ribosomal protein L4